MRYRVITLVAILALGLTQGCHHKKGGYLSPAPAGQPAR